jgi:hypothetical protein
MLKKIFFISILFFSISVSNLSAQISETDSYIGEFLENYDLKFKLETESKNQPRLVNERFVINTLKSLYDAEVRFAKDFGGGGFGQLQGLYASGLIDETLASGEKYGYIFSIDVRGMNNGIPPGFYITAKPQHYLKTGKKSFFMNASCLIRGGDKNGSNANENDPILESCSPYLSYQWEYDIWQGIGQIRLAQEDYRNGIGNGSYGTLSDLRNAGLINYFLSNNWNIWLSMQVFPPNGNIPPSYKIFARPQIYRETGIRSFYSDETGVLRGGDLDGQPANESSPIISPEGEELAKFVMRSLWTAQNRYVALSQYGNGNYATEYWQLTNSRMLTFDMTNGQFGDYRFEMIVYNRVFPKYSDFVIKATPLNYSEKTIRSFYISRFEFLRGADKGGKSANANDPIVEF